MSSACSSYEPFVLYVLDDSWDPDIPIYSIITIDPSGELYDGAFVAAHLSEGVELGRLQMTNGELRLIAHAQADECTADFDMDCIIGVVSRCTDSRRSYVKKFDRNQG